MSCTFEKLSVKDGKLVKKWLACKDVNRWFSIDNWNRFYRWVSRSPNHFLYAAKIGGRMLGMVELGFEGEKAHFALIIDPAEHNKGYGKQVLRHFLANAAAMTNDNAKVIVAGIEEGNHGSIRCFEACGFRQNGSDESGIPRYEYRL